MVTEMHFCEIKTVLQSRHHERNLFIQGVYKNPNKSKIALYFAKRLNVRFFVEIDSLGAYNVE